MTTAKKQLDITSLLGVRSFAASWLCCPATCLIHSLVRQASRYHPGRARGKLLRLLINHNLEFLFVQYPEFHDYQKELEPRAESISATTAHNNIMESFEAAKDKLKQYFKVSYAIAVKEHVLALSSR